MENFIVTALLVFIGMTVLMLVFVMWKSIGKNGFSAQDSKYIQIQWSRIVQLGKDDPRHAIMDADKLLDFVLKKKGYAGHLGEKLKSARSLFSDINGVWAAHKMRNKIAHELGVHVSAKECSRSLSQFRRALSDLGCRL